MTYLDQLGQEIRSAVPREVLPSGDTDSLFRLYALLALAKGAAVHAPDVHNAWSAWMQERDPDHAALRPFDELDPETQAADEPFVEAICAVSRRLELTAAPLVTQR